MNGRFVLFLLTHFLGALNNNLLKLTASLVVLNQPGNPALKLSLISALFTVPYLIFSPLCGVVCDRFSKSSVIRVGKAGEVLLMLVGAAGVLQQNLPMLFGATFLAGSFSCLISPAKYGYLPETTTPKSLSKANAYLEAVTLAGIIGGTGLSGILFDRYIGGLPATSVVLLVLAGVGLAASLRIVTLKAQAPEDAPLDRFFMEAVKSGAEIRRDAALLWVMLGIVFFWTYGAFFQVNFLLYAREVLLADESFTGVLLGLFGLSVAAGNLLAGSVSRGKVELGLVPLGALGLTASSLLLSLVTGPTWLQVSVLMLLGCSAGMFVVPLNSYFQQNTPAERRGRALAFCNLVSYAGMLTAAGLFPIGVRLGLSSRALFLCAGLITAILAVIALRKLPEMLLRFCNYVLVNVLYRMRVEGAENVPVSGGALLVANHVSYVDPLLILAALPRPVRFLMLRSLSQLPALKHLTRLMRVIPISPDDKPSQIREALREARSAVAHGELVCIFAEGALSRTGQMLPFGRGLETIMRDLSAPIIPVYLDRIWGSVFSHFAGLPFRKIPKQVPYAVTLMFGAPLPPTTRSFEVRRQVQVLGTHAFGLRSAQYAVLSSAVLRDMRITPFRPIFSDSTGAVASLLQCATGAGLLARQIQGREERSIGILLPPTVGAVVANLGVLFSGRTVVNLNYTLSREMLEACVAKAGVKTVITSRVFEKKLSLALSAERIYVEDLKKSSGLAKTLCATLLLASPGWLLRKVWPGFAADPHERAVLLFSSGSTGTPKGVQLTHANITSNVEGLYEVLQGTEDKALLGVLPFFHSLGLTGTLFLPLLTGMRVCYHTNPLDAATVGDLIQRERSTVLLATPTFLRAYIRKCKPEQLRSLQLVVAGAEKLPKALAEEFEQKFGVRPMEGYGATELSPVATINVPDVTRFGFTQKGNKEGSVGHPLPGVALRTCDPDTFQDRERQEEGLILVRGPNVMAGYLDDESRTAEVIRDGWYITGDLGVVDDDGFLTISGRMSRFSKIAGEMVSHGRVEEELQKIVGEGAGGLVVVGVPDEKRGERLLVLTKEPVAADKAVQTLRESKALPNLWIPDETNFHVVNDFPLLGTGKVDLGKAKKIAAEIASS